MARQIINASEREFILKKMESILTNFFIDKIIFVKPCPEPDRPVNLHKDFIILLLLEGRHWLYTAIEGIPEEITITKEQAFFFQPYAWFNSDYKFSGSGIAISYKNNSIQVNYFKHDVNPDAIPKENNPVSILYHTVQPLNETGLHILQALDSICSHRTDNDIELKLLYLLLQITYNDLLNSEELDYRKSTVTWLNIQNFIHNHYQHPITREKVAKLFKLNPSYVSRIFKKKSQQTFCSYLKKIRMEKADYFLKNTNLTIDDITLQCGYNDTKHFIKSFKSFYGISPGKYRNRHNTP